MEKASMPLQLTKEHFDEVVGAFQKRFDGTDKVIHGLREAVATKDDIRDVIKHFNQSQGLQNEHLHQMDAKIDAVIEMLAMRRELHNLVRVLKEQGVRINESEVFIT